MDVDTDGGRRRVGARMHCMCVRMDCLWTQISVKKKKKRKKTCGHANVLRVRADALRADVLVDGRG